MCEKLESNAIFYAREHLFKMHAVPDGAVVVNRLLHTVADEIGKRTGVFETFCFCITYYIPENVSCHQQILTI